MSCVYVFEAIDGALKVGRTVNLRVRKAQLVSQHGPLVLVAKFDVPEPSLARAEKHAHQLLRFWRRGGEWFEPTEWVKRAIREWVEAGGIHCPKWLYWLDMERGEPLPDWESRPEPDETEERREHAGWLRTGADRLVPVPMSLRPWSGPENRSQFAKPDRRRRLRVVPSTP